MSLSSLNIHPLHISHQPGINELMNEIVSEFEETIYSPGSKPLTEQVLMPGRHYWVAELNGTVVGTVGLSLLTNRSLALKSLFLSSHHRGQGIADALVNTVIDWAREQGLHTLYLGTMTQFKAAQRYYEKNGYTRITRHELPHDFPANPVDVVFYKKPL